MKKKIITGSAILGIAILGAIVAPTNSNAQILDPCPGCFDDKMNSPYGGCLPLDDAICQLNTEVTQE